MVKHHHFFSVWLFLLIYNLPAADGPLRVYPLQSLQSSDSLTHQRLAAQPGDVCIVCGKKLGKDGLVILYRGRRVPFYSEAQHKIFLKNPDYYFSRIQSTGALIHEDAVIPEKMKLGWFIFGVWVFVALLSGALAAGIALRKGFAAGTWFFIGLLFSLTGVIAVILKPAAQRTPLPDNLAKIPRTFAPAYCPNCGAGNHPSAHHCTSCKHPLETLTESDVVRLRDR